MHMCVCVYIYAWCIYTTLNEQYMCPRWLFCTYRHCPHLSL